VFLFAAGCEEARMLPPAEQIRALRQENRQLQNQLQQAQSQNEQLKKQVQVISGLPQDKLNSLYDLKKIKLTRYTNLYDKDKDGKKKMLIVYIQPIDAEDNKVKAGGAADVQLWDLSKESDKSLLAKWHVEPNELKKLWFDTVLTSNYRLAFDVNDIVKSFDRPLTVKVTFTDYLSGKVFEEQKVIKP
jgi:seryl-tRNA synthetase